MGLDHILVDQQGFGGAANAGAPHLGVEGHRDRHVELGGLVDEGVAEAFEMGEYRYAGFILHACDEGLAAAGDDDVDIAGKALQHFADRGAIDGGNQLDRGFG